MIPIEERIQEISKKCALDLSNNYKPLTNEGKVEVMIFTSLISLFYIQTRVFGTKYENITGKVYHNLIKEIKLYKPELSQDAIGNFISKRFEAYSGEIKMIFEGLGYMILQNSFYYFLINPLSDTRPSEPDITQIVIFTQEIIKVSNSAYSQFEELAI